MERYNIFLRCCNQVTRVTLTKIYVKIFKVCISNYCIVIDSFLTIYTNNDIYICFSILSIPDQTRKNVNCRNYGYDLRNYDKPYKRYFTVCVFFSVWKIKLYSFTIFFTLLTAKLKFLNGSAAKSMFLNPEKKYKA